MDIGVNRNVIKLRRENTPLIIKCVPYFVQMNANGDCCNMLNNLLFNSAKELIKNKLSHVRSNISLPF